MEYDWRYICRDQLAMSRGIEWIGRAQVARSWETYEIHDDGPPCHRRPNGRVGWARALTRLPGGELIVLFAS